jgi:hypothetical protein
VSIKSFPDYKHLLQKNYVEYKHIFLPLLNAEVLVVATKETGPEVNADKTKYMIISRDQNTGRSQSTRIDNSSIERVEELKYLGTTLTNQNYIQEEIKSRLKFGNACYYSVQFAIQKFKDQDI